MILLLSDSAVAQNSKGDRAEIGGGTNSRPRENRFRSNRIKKQRVKRTYNTTPGRFSLSNLIGSQRRKSNSNVYSQKSVYVNNQRRTPKDEAATPSKKPRVTTRSRSNASRNVYPQYSGTSNYKSRRPQRGNSKNVYPQYGKFTNNPARRPQNVQRPVSNRSTLARLNRLQGPSTDPRPGKKRRIVPRSASRSFIRNKTINSNAGFWNVKKKGEVAVLKDIAGRPLRAKNYETPRPGIIAPTYRVQRGQKRIGDRAYKGSAAGGHVTATRSARAWRGDIAKRRIRGRNFTSKSRIEGTPMSAPRRAKAKTGDRMFRGRGPSGGYKSASQSSEKRTGISPIPGRTPGIGANGIGNYRGSLKGRRPQKGGGSRSGRLWNNQGIAIQGRTPGMGADRVGTFQGNIKSRRQEKGGGSRSGRLWNNQGIAIQGRTPGVGADRIGTFQGNIKTGRPLKGGGSVSGRLWNNKQSPLTGRVPSSNAMKVGGYPGNIRRFEQSPGFSNQGEEFTGYIKTRRPLKGGGSVSGKLWNNKQSAIPGRTPSSDAMKVGGYPGNIKRFDQSPGFSDQGEEFTGYIKTRRPLKGGGSVSGKLWNNKETPLPGRGPSETARRAGAFQGNVKRFEQNPGFSDQGEEFTGFIKLPKLKRGYLKNPNAVEASVKKRRPNKNTYKVDDLQIKVERRDYIVNKNSAEEALKKLEPTATTNAVDGLQVKVQRRDYVKNKNSAEGSLKKLEPTKATHAVGNLQVKVKQYNYIHNSSSAKDALNVREPGKAFARATDYQGNIKMKKIDFTKMFSERNRELHPDAKFVKTNKNNVDEERSFMTNMKLWWSRKFRKNENLPDHLKEREHKPRYDKKEQGLWSE